MSMIHTEIYNTYKLPTLFFRVLSLPFILSLTVGAYAIKSNLLACHK